MPDVEGNDKGTPVETPLHAYKDGREDEVQDGSRGADGNSPTPEPSSADGGSYHDGGHESQPGGDAADPAR